MTAAAFAAGRPTSRGSSRTALAGLVISLAATLTLAPSTAHAAAPPGFVGLQSWNHATGANFQGLQKARISTYRIHLNWAAVEPVEPVGDCRSATGCKHEPYRWDRFDPIFENAGRSAIRVMPVLLGSPSWAASKQQNPPMHASDRQAFYDFAEAAAERYGPRSSFWRERGLDGAGVGAKYFQVWNEPTLPNYWNNRPNAAEYAAMVKGTFTAVKAGDSSATTILAGMPWSSAGPTPPDFWRSMFKADPRIFKYFNAAAIHPYARTPSLAISGVRTAASTLRSLTPRYPRSIWVTEMGWATPHPDGRFQVSERDQASYLKSFYDKLLAIKDRDRIAGAIWFSLQDRSGADWWAERTGLLRASGSAKPSWARMRCVTGALRC